MASQRFKTWLIVAAAVAFTLAGVMMIGLYQANQAHTNNGPTPTVTVTTPGATVTETHTQKAKPAETRTREVPGPTVTVTVTSKPKPAPTVTVTETVTATPDETSIVEGASYAPQPYALNVDTAMDRGWRFQRAAHVWNDALGCKVFAIDSTPSAGQSSIWVTQVEPGTLKLYGKHVRALYSGDKIEFDPKWGVESYISIHELGHALGLHHNDRAGSIMNVSEADRSTVNDGDVREAKKIQRDLGRC